MPTKTRTTSRTKPKSAPVRPARAGARRPPAEEAQAVVAWLERTGTKSTRDGMARYAIPSDQAFGVPVGALEQHAKRLGRDHDLAAALWDTGWYEARMRASCLDEPERWVGKDALRDLGKAR